MLRVSQVKLNFMLFNLKNIIIIKQVWKINRTNARQELMRDNAMA